MVIKFTFCAFIITLFVSVNFAQTTTDDDDYKKNEFYVGYSNQRTNGTSLNGAETSVVRNFNRYFGIKGSFSAVGNSLTFPGINVNGTTTASILRANNRIYNFLGGVQIKDNATKNRFKPFAHALVGVGVGRFKSTVENCPTASVCNVLINPSRRETGFSGVFGGGLDIRVNNRVDIRAIQMDYNPIYFESEFRNTARFGIGIVFH